MSLGIRVTDHMVAAAIHSGDLSLPCILHWLANILETPEASALFAGELANEEGKPLLAPALHQSIELCRGL